MNEISVRVRTGDVEVSCTASDRVITVRSGLIALLNQTVAQAAWLRQIQDQWHEGTPADAGVTDA